jgi:hypothetical protein
MNRRKLALATVALFASAVALPATEAATQQMQRVSYKTPAANSKYSVQHVLEVGDIPGHQVRLFELRRTFSTDAPTINSVKMKETISRGLSDYIDTNGSNTNYVDMSWRMATSFSAGKRRCRRAPLLQMESGRILPPGGTGKFATITGLVRTTNIFDAKARINDGESEIEYSISR